MAAAGMHEEPALQRGAGRAQPRHQAGQDVVRHGEQGKIGLGEQFLRLPDRHPGQHPRGALHRGLGDRGHTGQVVPGPGERSAEGGPDPPGADDAHPEPGGMGLGRRSRRVRHRVSIPPGIGRQ